MPTEQNQNLFSLDNLESLILPLELLLIVQRSTVAVLLKPVCDLSQDTQEFWIVLP